MTRPSDRRRNLLAAWHVESGRLVTLGKDPDDEQVTPIRRSSLAWAAEWSKYAMNRTIGRPAADIALVDVTTGARTPVRSSINDRFVQAGPSGKYLLFIEGNQYWTVNLASRAVTNITRALPTSFIDLQSDQTSPQKPPFGVAGWTKDDGAVLLNDRYDVWQVPTDGSKATRLTDGAAEQVRHRLVRLDPDEEWVDPTKPLYFALSGEWTKKSGYARREPSGAVTRLVWLDKAVAGLAKARMADIFGYVVQDYDDPPDYFVGGPDLSGANQVTKVNAFQSDYAWGRSRAPGLQDAERAPAPGVAPLPGRVRSGAQVPDDRLQLRAAVAERAPLRGADRPRVLQRQRLHHATATSSSSPTSSSPRGSPGRR